MSLFVTSLNSGSNGNCYYISNDEDAVLIDAGISCREIEKRMKRLGLSIAKVRAIFVSHEHSDHINGIPTLSKKHQIPVYITATTLAHSGMALENHLVFSFSASAPVMIGGLSILAFVKYHDAVDPHSFVIEYDAVKVGVFTDIGIACREVISHFGRCNAAFLETNYDESMLEKGSYPIHLKKRIRDGRGHLSNHQALDLLLTHKPPFMSHLFLSHLSQNNNDPDLARKLFDEEAGATRIIVASRYEETAVYEISHVNMPVMPTRVITTTKKKVQQLSMFDHGSRI